MCSWNGDIRYGIKVCSVTTHPMIMESNEGILPHKGEAGYRILSPLTCDPSLYSELGQLRPPSVTICVIDPRHRASSSWGTVSLKQWTGELMLTIFFFLSLKSLQASGLL